jgi:hypothetical protein
MTLDARRNGQLPSKLLNQKCQPEPFGQFMLRLTFWQGNLMWITISPSIKINGENGKKAEAIFYRVAA